MLVILYDLFNNYTFMFIFSFIIKLAKKPMIKLLMMENAYIIPDCKVNTFRIFISLIMDVYYSVFPIYSISDQIRKFLIYTFLIRAWFT
jgi:hypothetical protein